MGKPSVDLFASRLLHQLPRYMSWKLDPCRMAVDALQQKWTNMFHYAFPPFFSNREGFKENPKGQSYYDYHYSNMTVATVVPLALENEHKKSNLTSRQKHPSHETSRVNSPTH